MKLFAPCPRGLEPALVDELQKLGALEIAAVAGGVAFAGDRGTAYRVNLHSRIASRVLLEVASARYHNDDDLYKLAARTPWETLLTNALTLRVDTTAIRSSLRSLNFATLRVKDGIVDRMRAQTGDRPSIDTHAPGARVFAFLQDRAVSLYLDLSGESLFKRGWRGGPDDKGEAALKENLAAGLLWLARWQPDQPLYDPFCGSGTIVIEAAQIAAGIAPGSTRSFGFERLPDHDAALWEQLRAHAQQQAQAARAALAHLQIAASDIDPRAVAQCRHNLVKAGLPDDLVSVKQVDFVDARPPFATPGVIVCNPPYGERIEVQGQAARQPMVARDTFDASVYRPFGQTLKQHFSGWRACFLAGDRGFPAAIGMKERRKTPLFNGPIECRLFEFEVFEARGAQPAAST